MFYTYLWLREDGTPYYVGKGSGNRAIAWHKRLGNAPEGRVVLYVAKDEADAFETEVALIWYYGRKDLDTGCLRNLTDGGENPPRTTLQSAAKGAAKRKGVKCPEVSLRMRGNQFAKGVVFSEERRKYLSYKLTGKVKTQETCQRISKAKKGKVVISAEQRTAISKALTKTHCKQGHLLREGSVRRCLICLKNQRAAQGRKIVKPGSDKPFCLRGHARTSDNVYASGDCKVCAKDRAKKFQRKTK